VGYLQDRATNVFQNGEAVDALFLVITQNDGMTSNPMCMGATPLSCLAFMRNYNKYKLIIIIIYTLRY